MAFNESQKLVGIVNDSCLDCESKPHDVFIPRPTNRGF